MQRFFRRAPIVFVNVVSRYICLDEGDRMLDMGFDEEVGEAFRRGVSNTIASFFL